MADRLNDMPVQFVKGIGPVRAGHLGGLGIHTAADLLLHLPFRYEHLPRSKPIGRLTLDETATIVGQVRRIATRRGMRRSSLLVDVTDATGECRVRWFNAPFLRDKLAVGQVVRLTGKVDADDRQALLTNPRLSIVPDEQDPFEEDRDAFVPVYPATAGLTSVQIASAIRNLLGRLRADVIDFVPTELRAKHKLPPRATALMRVHAPTTLDDVEIARRRLAYDELLVLQLRVQTTRRRRAIEDGAPVIGMTPAIARRIRARLPFDLTAAQQRVTGEIAADLARTRPMARLLHGDVGAGKTAVAVHAALTVVANRHQVALLAPLEVLARQLYDRFTHYLDGSQVSTGLLVGGLPARQRRDLLAALADGTLDIVVGTHAMLEDDVAINRLGLVIVDEQHRFGVQQRQVLRGKGHCPHYLAMSATPIPRTLAMTLYGDLDVSTLDELPPGRQPIRTAIVTPNDADAMWSRVRARLEAGEQAFIVCPLVEESAAIDLKAATDEHARLQRAELAGMKLGLLHGRMPAAEKQRIVTALRTHDLQAIVCTTVIEVGVDVPQATVMVVEHAERFGLAQLHQLRGRIGRGSKASTCYLLTPHTGGPAAERLRILCTTQDGFRIAEADLALRGPGELHGRRQHGLPTLRVADLARDLDLLTAARDDAAALLASDPDLAQSEHQALRAELTGRG